MKGRQRGRNGGKPRMHHQGGGGGGRNPNFDHNAGRMRGNAQQLLDKYMALGRDASSQGDRVLAENYFQHADHYYRVVNTRFEGQQGQQNQQRNFNNQHQRGGYETNDGQGGYNDYNRSDMPPGPSQNLIPAATPSMEQVQPPQQQQVQQQPSFEQNYQPSSQPAPREPDGDIGLPPQLFGEPAPRVPDQAGPNDQQNRDQNRGNGDDRGSRPRHTGRRRFSARPPQSEPTSGDAS